jgi:signal transduction histidine kinase
MLETLFDAFVSSKPNGLGIGLSIGRTIVEAHGGRIAAANIAGGGASFRVTLPLAAND